MSTLDDLIRIKTRKQDDDLLKMLDEIAVYEKLSADEKLKDLTHSEVTRKKCPLLAAFADGEMYETILAELASNVYLQIEGSIPPILITATEMSVKKQKQMAILQNGITHVSYRDLLEYNHEIMKPFIAAVFVKNYQDGAIAAIIVKEPGGYVMYHGMYTVGEEDVAGANTSSSLICKGKKGIFTMDSYSVLGNNGYPFGHYANEKVVYDVMIGPDNVLYLLNGEIVVTRELTGEDKNVINMAKKDPDDFAKAVTSIIERVV